MLDNGFPLATETNILKELIRPPSILPNSVVNTVTGKKQLVKFSYTLDHMLNSTELALLYQQDNYLIFPGEGLVLNMLLMRFAICLWVG